MTKPTIQIALGVLCAASMLMAQKPKSKAEVDALLAVQNAKTPDARITAVDTLLDKFSDTEFKGWALYIAAESASQKGDYATMVVYAQRTLEADPKNYQAMLLLARGIANQTKKFDLDKEEKLTRAKKYANDAIALLKDAPKPNPQLPDDQWANIKRDLASQGYEALGMIELAREKYDDAIAQYKTALTTAATPDPATYVRLGDAQNKSGKYDDAIATFDKVIGMSDASPQVKQVAQNFKAQAMKSKGQPPAAK